MNFCCVVLIAIFCIISINVNAELFSSINEFQKLVFVENEFLGDLRKFLTTEKENLDFLERELNIFEKENEVAMQDPLTYTSNVLNSFLIVHRLTTEIANIETRFFENYGEFSNALERLFSSSLMETIFEDKTGIVRSIAHLQSVYNLQAKDLIQGIILGNKYREPLKINNVIEIGVLLNNLTDCEKSSEWLKEAIPLIENEISSKNEKNEYYLYLILQFLKCNQVEYAKSVYSMTSMGSEFFENFQQLQIETKSTTEHTFYNREYERICGKSDYTNYHKDPNLYCFYVTNSSYTRLFQYKAEMVNIDPPVYIFHDIITDPEMDELKGYSEKFLIRAGTTKSFNQTSYDFDRIAKHNWIQDSDHQLTARLSKRIERLTGLSTETSEMLQVQNYGIAGHFTLHTDFFDKNADITQDGDRIATFMFYLSDVELGGGTAFAPLNLLVEPEKGAAIFWYNLYKSLKGDYRTLHAGCPVIIGSKWVANKWIRSKGQMFKRPCALENDAREFNYDNEVIFN